MEGRIMRKTTIGLVWTTFVALGAAGSPWLATRSVHASGFNKLLTTLDPPGSIDTRPFGISSTGDAVGITVLGSNRSRRHDGENETRVCDGRAAERDARQHEHSPCEDLAIVGR